MGSFFVGGSMQREAQHCGEEANHIAGLINTFVSVLNEEADLILVEGPHDAKSLRMLGALGDIIEVSSFRKPLTTLVDWVVGRYRGKCVAILLDFDKHGEELCHRLGSEFSERGVRIQTSARDVLREILARLGFTSVENLMLVEEPTIRW